MLRMIVIFDCYGPSAQKFECYDFDCYEFECYKFECYEFECYEFECYNFINLEKKINHTFVLGY